MTVVAFVPRKPHVTPGGWQSAELQRVLDACAESVARGDISGWDTGVTEAGDPQLYLLGPAPDRECVLCLSRLGRLYVLEDGEGRILHEHDGISLLAEQVRGALRRKKSAIVARIALGWIALKETVEERIEALTAEPAEVLTHLVPQVAALV